MRHSEKSASELLNSWKEIAEYLERGVRTVQRWEHELQLPIHRIGKGKRSPVYTTIAEIRFWISAVEASRMQRPSPPQLIPLQPGNGKQAEVSRLLSNVHSLARSVAENILRQQQQAEILQSRLLQMRSSR